MKPYIYAYSFIVVGLLLVTACTKNTPDEFQANIYLVRHFEKQAPTQETGNDVSLSLLGQRNANNLAAHLLDKNIDSIYSTDYKRTMQSVEPLSKALGVNISLYKPTALAELSAQLRLSTSNQLVVGHSNTTGVLFGLLGCEQPSLTESDYGDIMVLSRSISEGESTLLACTTYKLPESAFDIQSLSFIKPSELSRYWTQTNHQFSVVLAHNGSALQSQQEPLSPVSAEPSMDRGMVEVGFIIDESGMTSNFEIIKSNPAYTWDLQAVSAAKQLTFIRNNNQDKRVGAIYTTWKFSFQGH